MSSYGTYIYIYIYIRIRIYVCDFLFSYRANMYIAIYIGYMHVIASYTNQLVRIYDTIILVAT